MLKKSMSKSAMMIALVTGNVIWGGTVVHAEEPREVFTLDQIVVTATRTEKKIIDTPASVSIITAEDIEISGATTVDQVFKRVPGVTVSRTGGLANSKPVVTMRGVKSGSDVLVLVDGQPMVNAYSGTVNFNDIPIDSIEKIEVVKGAASSIYGSNAMAGVISITTKNSEKFHAKTSLTYGTNHTWIKKVSVGDKIDKFSYDLYYQGTDSHTYGDTASASIDEKDGKNNYTTTSGYDIVSNTQGTGSTAIVGKKGDKIWNEDNYSGKFTYKFDEEKSLNIGFLRTKNDYSIDYASHEKWIGKTGYIDAGGNKGFYVPDSTFDSSSGGIDERIYTIGYRDTASGITVTGGLTDNRSWNGGKYTTSGTNLSVYGSKRYTFGISKETNLSSNDNAIFGIQYKHDSMDKVRYPYDKKLGKVQEYIDQAGAGKADTYSVYFQNEHKFNDRISVIGAVRYDRWRSKDGYCYDKNGFEDSPASRSDSALSPKIAFNYKFDDTQSMYISWGKAFSAPSLYDMFSGTLNGATSSDQSKKNVVIPNPGLKPQIITTTEAGWKKDFNGKTTIEVAVFHNKIKNISYQSDLGYTQKITDTKGTYDYPVYQNVSGGEGETNGIEIGVTHQFDNKLSLYVNATIQNPTITKTNNEKEVDKIVRLTPKRLLNIGLDYIDNKFAAELAGSYYSKKYSKADNSDVVTGVPGAYDPVFLVGLNTRYAFDKHHTVEFTVNNLLDREYYNSSLGQGRNFLLTYSYAF